LVCGAVLAFARVPAWETGGVGTSRFASVRRPGWVSDAPRVASKVVIGVSIKPLSFIELRSTRAFKSMAEKLMITYPSAAP